MSIRCRFRSPVPPAEVPRERRSQGTPGPPACVPGAICDTGGIGPPSAGKPAEDVTLFRFATSWGRVASSAELAKLSAEQFAQTSDPSSSAIFEREVHPGHLS